QTLTHTHTQTHTHTYRHTMYGCEWDDETGEVKGYQQHGFDGEDFLSYDHETESYIAPRQQAVITQQRWNNNKALMANKKHYFTEECPEFLKKYVNYGRSSLMRTELPSVSLLQKTPSSPVCCHATGFYPTTATLFWRKDGEELHEDVDPGEILPNHDGSFQMSVDLKLSSVPAEDWRRYECVFQLSGKTSTHNDGIPGGMYVSVRESERIKFIQSVLAARKEFDFVCLIVSKNKQDNKQDDSWRDQQA
uniref:Ig-like domain-containing protein n=1 Tax=Cyclopterus lumpus TaxID=8103 RepID=A0A8C2WGI1_CYCLU